MREGLYSKPGRHLSLSQVHEVSKKVSEALDNAGPHKVRMGIILTDEWNDHHIMAVDQLGWDFLNHVQDGQTVDQQIETCLATGELNVVKGRSGP